MKFLVVGLGNPGPDYEETRHNIGFKVMDALAMGASISFSPDRYGDHAEFRHKGKTFVLVKPSTFMNLSGKAVRYWMDQENVPLERVLVVTDDLALPFGKLRLRASGSAGGHNGLGNITELLGTEQYARLRFGIGSDFARGRQVDYVLAPWSQEEQKTLKERIDLATNAVKAFGLMGTATAMNIYNTR